jgi:hypothetical protein
MSGHGEKLTRKQEQAVGALLATATLAEAAQTAGVGEATLRRWLKLPGFRRAYLDARRQVVEGVVSRLQQLSTKAVVTLERNLDSGSAATEVRAALGVLEQAFRGAELLDLVERVEQLEQRQQHQEKKVL